MKTEKTFKILSIDGGGIKGLYSAQILNEFEKELRKKHGEDKRIVDYFDLICGTSTGGLIALALSVRVPTETISNFYTLHGPIIFKKSKGILATARQTLFFGKYSDKNLRKALLEMFGEKKIGDSESLLCIPTFDYTHNTYDVFKYDHQEGNLNRDNPIPMIDIALATSAAPTFFPIAEIEKLDNRQFVDGGVWANNPSLVGFTEAIRYFVGEGKQYNKIQILSVSSLNAKKGRLPFGKKNKSFIGYKEDLIDFSLTGQSEFTDIFLSSMKEYLNFTMDYIRIPSHSFAPEPEKFIGLDIAKRESFALMKQAAREKYDIYKHDPLVKSMFTTEKTYKIK
jgi:hypothetical protein